MTVPSGEVTVLMSWPRFVEAGRVNLMTAGTATTHRSRTVAIHRSGDAVPRAQAHHRSSPPWRDLAASASLLVRIRMLVPSDAACSSGASANRRSPRSSASAVVRPNGRALAAGLAEDQGDVHVEVNVGHPQARDLATPGAGVEEEGDQGGVPARFEALAGAGGEQPP